MRFPTLLAGVMSALFPFSALAADAMKVTLEVDASRPVGELRPIWRFFGYDEPNYTYMPDGKRLLGELGKLGRPQVFIRAHSLLCTGNGSPALKWGSTNAYTEDANGNPVYDWTIIDRIFDSYLERGLKPYVQIGFMPEALSSKPQPYQHNWKPGDKYETIYTGWVHPPKDYEKWRALCRQWVLHSVEKYGKAEVESWYWELWNEPDSPYWGGTPQEYHKLYDYTVAGVREALATAKVGGPHVTGPGGDRGRKFLRDFLEHCLRGKNHVTGQIGTPIDFIAFHAKGAPRFVDGHVRMAIANQLRDIDRGFETVASFPELKDKPIVIGESDPDGCAACPATLYPQNAYRNGTLYAAYTAATFARKHELAARHRVNFIGATTWAFEFEDQPYFAGFRVLSSNGLDLPVLNVFRMMGKMQGQRLAVSSSAAVDLSAITKAGVREGPDVSALASLGDRTLCVLAWHYHDDDVAGPAAEIELSIAGLPEAAKSLKLDHFRIDDGHSNAYSAWKRMGSPQQPTADQKAKLVEAGKLQMMGEAQAMKSEEGALLTKLSLPRQAVSLLVVTW